MQVKINIDGGSRGNPGPGAAAYVICSLDGKILAQEGYYLPHCTNNQAEYTALKLALIKAKELGATELFIQSDSQLLVKQYLGEYKIKHPDLAARMAYIRRLAAGVIIHIEHVLRHLNKAPDALANKAMDAKQSLGFNPIIHFPPEEPPQQPQAPHHRHHAENSRHPEQQSYKSEKEVHRPGLEPEFRRWQRLVITTTLSMQVCSITLVKFTYIHYDSAFLLEPDPCPGTCCCTTDQKADNGPCINIWKTRLRFS